MYVRVLDVLGVVISSIISFLSFVLGGFDGILITLIWFVVIDYLTGVMSAIVNKQLSSDIGMVGIVKKLSIFVIISVAVFLNNYLGIPAIREVVIMFFISNEGISILENYSEISGIEAPEVLKNTLKNIKDKNKGE